ncbi:ankyrin repeat domain-containing protein [Verrucomicrobia bacterium]|nr:ankyrin repeat domain-containing protein [Verrucomicrobiota bacterium]
MHEAVEREDIKTLKEHLEFGTDVNARKDGRTCLHTAAWLGYTELAKLPIAGGTELDCYPLLAFRPLNLNLDTLVDHAAAFD